jgi:hypothetical protein
LTRIYNEVIKYGGDECAKHLFELFWSLIGSKTFETIYFSGSGIFTQLDQGCETSAHIDNSKEKILHQKYFENM